MSSIDLTNCDREPIHIPGSIQPHGALIAFDEDLVIHQVSQNAQAFLGASPQDLLTTCIGDELLGAGACEQIREGLAATRFSLQNPIPLRNGALEGSVHRSGQALILEVEPAPVAAKPAHQFAVAAQSALAQFHHCSSLDELADLAAREIKAMTMFDRVMVYRFAQDSSGEVIAEAREPHLQPFLGLHYPAGDIPKQARRLYLLNAIRLIADAKYEPVQLSPVLDPRTSAPLDLTHSVLRSVSPIHCEYLANMGVRASMSISLIVDGRLWGLLACHHHAPLQVPFSTRIAAQVLGQTLGMLVGQLERDELHRRERFARRLERTLIDQCRVSEDPIRGLVSGERSLREMVDADGFAVTLDSRIATLGELAPSREWLASFVDWLHDRDNPQLPFVADTFAELPELQGASDMHACGVMVVPYHHARTGYIMCFRSEHSHSVKWGHNAIKGERQFGLNGRRLSPEGSFEVWQEQVAGRSKPWTGIDVEVMQSLAQSLSQLQLEHAAVFDQMREFVIGMVSHDLRTPLQAMTFAANMLDGDSTLATRLHSSSQRMARLVDSLTDFSLIRGGRGLGLKLVETDLHQLAQRIIDEIYMAYPGLQMSSKLEGDGIVCCDPHRIEQVLSNLLSNARHHGDRGLPIAITISDVEPDRVAISVHNWGAPISQREESDLFEPYQGEVRGKSRPSGGVGLGLYITRSIIEAHQGSISVSSAADTGTEFLVVLPRHPEIDEHQRKM